MTIGDLVILHNCQTTGYRDGDIGILVKVEPVGKLYSIYWILMSDDNKVPMWSTEFKVLSGKRRSNNCN